MAPGLKRNLIATVVMVAAALPAPLLSQTLVRAGGPGPQAIIRRQPSIRRTGTSTSVAVRIVDGLPTIELQVNGRGPFRFVVDTGQPFPLSLTPDAARVLGLRRTGEMLMGDPSGAAPLHVPTFAPVDVRVGTITFSGVEASAAAMRRAPGNDVMGTIGLGLFHGLTMTIDYGRSQFRASLGRLPAADGNAIVQGSVDRMGLVSVPLRIGRSIHEVDLDTGNGRAPLFMPTSEVSALGTRGDARSFGMASTIARQIALNAVDLALPVRIGAVTLPVTSVAYPSVGTHGNLGSLALGGLAVTIDTVTNRVKFNRTS